MKDWFASRIGYLAPFYDEVFISFIVAGRRLTFQGETNPPSPGHWTL